jgi:hypothetical protein
VEKLAPGDACVGNFAGRNPERWARFRNLLEISDSKSFSPVQTSWHHKEFVTLTRETVKKSCVNLFEISHRDGDGGARGGCTREDVDRSSFASSLRTVSESQSAHPDGSCVVGSILVRHHEASEDTLLTFE